MVEVGVLRYVFISIISLWFHQRYDKFMIPPKQSLYKNIRQVGVYSPPPIHESRPLPPPGETTIQNYNYLFIIPNNFIPMSNIRYPYTQEEIYNNYEFKVVKRALMNQFPWIKDITVDQEQLDRYNIVFLNFDIDVTMLGEEYEWTLTPWVLRASKENKRYHGMYLGLFFQSVGYDETKHIIEDIEKTIKDINKSPALPSELKMKGDRRFSVGDFTMNKDRENWY